LGGVLIHIIREKALPEQISEMLEELENYIKIAVDVRQGILAGGGSLHADCEAALLDAGSEQKDIWGADWIPTTQEIRYESLINLRPGQGSFSLVPEDESLRRKVRAITVGLLGDG
jgi:hypothetical protein